MKQINRLPILIDNKSEDSQLDSVLASLVIPHLKEMSIAVGYFYLSGVEALISGFQQLDIEKAESKPVIRVIMSPRTDMPTKEALTEGHDGENIEKEALVQFENDLHENNFQAGELLIALLKANFVQVKLFTKDMFHAKVYNAKVDHGGFEHYYSIVGSSNFSSSGFTNNLELNLPVSSEDTYNRIRLWFDELWQKEAIDFNEKLIKIIENSGTLGDNQKDVQPSTFLSPFDMIVFLVYLYLGFIPRENLQQVDQLAEFQKIGAENVFYKLEQFGGAIVADSVGLGKTFTAGEVIRRRYKNNKRILIIAPPALLEQWKYTLKTYFQLPENDRIQYLSQGKLSQSSTVDVKELVNNKQIDLIVLDEAHRARNAETNLHKNIAKLHPKYQRAEVLLLTATPYNNTVQDLQNLIYLCTTENRLTNAALSPKAFEDFAKKSRELKAGKSVEELEADPDFLQARENIQAILNHTMLLRTRTTIKDKYHNVKIAGKKLVFYDPEVEKIPYRYDTTYHELFENLSSFVNSLNLPHILLSKPESGQVLTYLFHLLLFKRIESSIYAFYESLENIKHKEEALQVEIEETEDWQELLDKYNQRILSDEKKDLVTEELDTIEAEVVGKDEGEQARYFDKNDVQKWIEEDLFTIDRFLQRYIYPLRREPSEPMSISDPKIDHFLSRIVMEHFQKALVFTEYQSTARYLEYRLQSAIVEGRLNLRFDVTMGGDDQMEGKLDRFAPLGRNNSELDPQKELDLLVSTDVLSEGVNLQDANLLINFDLPWNPMRIVQRVGRVNRIGSENRVRVLNFVPDEVLERFLNLLNILHSKISQVTMLLGKEMAILSSQEELQQITPKDIGEKIKNIQEAKSISQVESMSRDQSFLAQIEGESQEDYFRANLFETAREVMIRDNDFRKLQKQSQKTPVDQKHFFTILDANPDNLFRLYTIYAEREGKRDVLQRLWLKTNAQIVQEKYPYEILPLDWNSLKGYTKSQVNDSKLLRGLQKRSDEWFQDYYDRFREHYKKRSVDKRTRNITGVQRDILIAYEAAAKQREYESGKTLLAQADKTRSGGADLVKKIIELLKEQNLGQKEKKFFNDFLRRNNLDLRYALNSQTYGFFLSMLFDFHDHIVADNAQLRGALYTKQDIHYSTTISIFYNTEQIGGDGGSSR